MQKVYRNDIIRRCYRVLISLEIISGINKATLLPVNCEKDYTAKLFRNLRHFYHTTVTRIFCSNDTFRRQYLALKTPKLTRNRIYSSLKTLTHRSHFSHRNIYTQENPIQFPKSHIFFSPKYTQKEKYILILTK